MSKKETMELVVLGPGQKGFTKRLPVVMDTLADYDDRYAVLFSHVTPSRRRTARRFSPWIQEVPIVVAEYGDGEALDFEAGPADDWRNADTEITEEYKDDFQVKAETLALMRAHNAHTQPPSLASRMITLTFLSVLFVMLLTLLAYVQASGGITGLMSGWVDAGGTPPGPGF
jgi:hypothetical protein